MIGVDEGFAMSSSFPTLFKFGIKNGAVRSSVIQEFSKNTVLKISSY